MMAKKEFNLEKEIVRLTAMSDYEKEAFDKGFNLIGGIDEAGRGPFVGPVVAACVILKKNALIPGLNDSKQVSEKKRELLYEEIINQSVAIGVGQVNNNVIDEINILNATKKAMRDAINNMAIKPDYLLIDYVKLDNLAIPQLSMVKGDCKSVSVAAASIIAKVSRDRMMRDYAKMYPQYGFESNKGYGTPEHLKALIEHGPCPLHRISFIKNYIA